jgi:hypothetical protein
MAGPGAQEPEPELPELPPGLENPLAACFTEPGAMNFAQVTVAVAAMRPSALALDSLERRG